MGRKIRARACLQGHDFKKYIRNEASADVRMRLLGLSHVQEGKSCRETSRMVKVHENTVQDWVQRFKKGGLEGLQTQPGQGAHKRINKEDMPRIKEGILALQATRAGGRMRGQDVQKYLLDEWNVAYKLSAIYNLLKDLRIVWISARSKHPASNIAEQNAFKKTLLIRSKSVCPQKPI